jgi:hypothetical protein
MVCRRTTRAPFDAHHHGLAGAVDVRVEQADRGPLGRQGQRQIHRRRALAHAALAGSHGNDVLDLRQQGHAALGGMGHDLLGDVGRHVLHAGDAFGRGDQGPAKRRDLALGRIAKLHVEGDISARDLKVFECLGRDEIGAGVGVDDGLQGLQQLVWGGHSGIFRRNEGSGAQFSHNL